MTAWWDPQTGEIVGYALSGVLGGIGGGVGGFLTGRFAGRGRRERLVIGWFQGLGVICLTLIGAGAVAAAMKQPHHVWYPILLPPGVVLIIAGCLLPALRQRYRQAERRRLDSALLRGGRGEGGMG